MCEIVVFVLAIFVVYVYVWDGQQNISKNTSG